MKISLLFWGNLFFLNKFEFYRVFFLFVVVIGLLCVFYLKGFFSCGMYEIGDKRKGWIFWVVLWYCVWFYKEFYV